MGMIKSHSDAAAAMSEELLLHKAVLPINEQVSRPIRRSTLLMPPEQVRAEESTPQNLSRTICMTHPHPAKPVPDVADVDMSAIVHRCNLVLQTLRSCTPTVNHAASSKCPDKTSYTLLSRAFEMSNGSREPSDPPRKLTTECARSKTEDSEHRICVTRRSRTGGCWTAITNWNGRADVADLYRSLRRQLALATGEEFTLVNHRGDEFEVSTSVPSGNYSVIIRGNETPQWQCRFVYALFALYFSWPCTVLPAVVSFRVIVRPQFRGFFFFVCKSVWFKISC